LAIGAVRPTERVRCFGPNRERRAAVRREMGAIRRAAVTVIHSRDAAPEDVTCFLNNIGLGYQFAVVGAIAWRNARAAGRGHDLPTDWFTEDVHP
jgi:hypothetical protein